MKKVWEMIKEVRTVEMEDCRRAILEIPEFLGVGRESSETYEIYPEEFREEFDFEGNSRGEFSIKTSMEYEPGDFCYIMPGKYVLFELKLDGLLKPIVRFSHQGGNSHLGIIGGVIGELARELNLTIDDIKLRQSHHGEEPLLIEKSFGDFHTLRVKVLGGGFIEINPKTKKILLKERSQTLQLQSGQWTEAHQLMTHLVAKGVVENWLRNQNQNFTVEVEYPHSVESLRSLGVNWKSFFGKNWEFETTKEGHVSKIIPKESR